MRPVAIVLTVALLVVGGVLVAAPVSAAADQPDACRNADRGPGANGPPGFVGGLLPDFLGDLFASLPVPNFVKAWFGAGTC